MQPDHFESMALGIARYRSDDGGAGKSSVLEPNAFQLSRIYSQGWNAARKLLADARSDVDKAQAATLNPHRTVEERERWSRGFEEALRRPLNTRSRNSWR